MSIKNIKSVSIENSKKNQNMNNIPLNNLNIAFIGEVSTGKSTLLNEQSLILESLP